MKLNLLRGLGAAFALVGSSALLLGAAVGRIGEDPIQAGRELYLTHCAACHGQDARGGPGMPSLHASALVIRGDEVKLLEVIRDGIEGKEMPPLAAGREDLQKLVVYLNALNAPDSTSISTADVREGARVFRKEGCLRCHRIEGEGAFSGRDLSDVGIRRTGAQMMAILRDPGLHASEHYRAVVLTMARGEAVRGVLMNRDNFSIQLLDRDGRLRLFWQNEVRTIEPDPTAAVKDYTEALSQEDMRRLIGFLESQRSAVLRVSPGTAGILPR